jgi:hypothetical protein
MTQQPKVIVPWFNASSQNDGSCVDAQFLEDGSVQVRHSNGQGPIINYTGKEWDAFIAGAKSGKFDRPAI